MIHEFFHTIQTLTIPFKKYAITQIHEYKNIHRHKIPGWKGKGEIDYYVWRFKNTIDKIGYRYLNKRYRKGYFPSDKTIAVNKSLVKNINLSKLRKAFYLFRKTSKKSMSLCKKVLKLNPYHHKALSFLAKSYGKKKQYKKALKYWKILSLLTPDKDFTYIELARIYSKLKQHKKAINAYSRAIKINSDYAWYYYWRGTKYFTTKEYKKVIQDLKKFLTYPSNF